MAYHKFVNFDRLIQNAGRINRIKNAINSAIECVKKYKNHKKYLTSNDYFSPILLI